MSNSTNEQPQIADPLSQLKKLNNLAKRVSPAIAPTMVDITTLAQLIDTSHDLSVATASFSTEFNTLYTALGDIHAELGEKLKLLQQERAETLRAINAGFDTAETILNDMRTFISTTMGTGASLRTGVR